MKYTKSARVDLSKSWKFFLYDTVRLLAIVWLPISVVSFMCNIKLQCSKGMGVNCAESGFFQDNMRKNPSEAYETLPTFCMEQWLYDWRSWENLNLNTVRKHLGVKTTEKINNWVCPEEMEAVEKTNLVGECIHKKAEVNMEVLQKLGTEYYAEAQDEANRWLRCWSIFQCNSFALHTAIQFPV